MITGLVFRIAKRIAFKVMSMLFTWDIIFDWFLQIARSVFDEWQEKERLDKKDKYFVITIYVLVEGLGEEWARDTKTDYDDKSVKWIIESCVQMANTHNFTLPPVQEL